MFSPESAQSAISFKTSFSKISNNLNLKNSTPLEYSEMNKSYMTRDKSTSRVKISSIDFSQENEGHKEYLNHI